MGYWSLVYRILRAIIRAGFTSMAHKSAIAKYDKFFSVSQNHEDIAELKKKVELAYRKHLDRRTEREDLFEKFKKRYGYDFPL